MFEDATAVAVRYQHADIADERFADARRAAVDHLGHLHLYADQGGSSTVAVVAAGAWLSYRLERVGQSTPDPEPVAPAVEPAVFVGDLNPSPASTSAITVTAEPGRLLRFPTERLCASACCQATA